MKEQRTTTDQAQLVTIPREALAVDNFPRSWGYWVGRTGIVHRSVSWSECTVMWSSRYPKSSQLPAGPRCSSCFPTSEVARRGRTMTGWPRDDRPANP